MAHHPLLDWRLGLDMVRLALDPEARLDLTYPYWQPLLAQVIPGYYDTRELEPATFAGLPAGIDFEDNAYIIVHPLWEQEQAANFHPQLAQAWAEARAQGLTPMLRSLFNVVRMPYE
jgi:hypothetical protein